jgi:WD40 repeat protein
VYPPKDWVPSPDSKKLPSQSLELEYIYGYRGHDCRDNLFYTSDTTVVYHAAAVGVVHDLSSNTQIFYKEHNDDIVRYLRSVLHVICFSLAIHPQGEIVATGQVSTLKASRKPKICVWNSKTMSTLAVLEDFHQRSVCALAFSADGNYLLSVGSDDHNSVCVYDWKHKKNLANAFGHSSKVFGKANLN